MQYIGKALNINSRIIHSIINAAALTLLFVKYCQASPSIIAYKHSSYTVVYYNIIFYFSPFYFHPVCSHMICCGVKIINNIIEHDDFWIMITSLNNMLESVHKTSG
jgi:hypothetical protein